MVSSKPDTHTSFPGTHSVANNMDERSKGWQEAFGIGKAASRELHQSPDHNMAPTAIHLREHIFDLQQKFDGEFAPNAQEI